MNPEEALQICKNALYIANGVLVSLGDEGIKTVSYKHDVGFSTIGDKAVSQHLIDFFKRQRIPAILYSEEVDAKTKRIKLGKNPKGIITIDEIDGTHNYLRGISPYCTVITIFDSPEPYFRDALACGIIEHTERRLWWAVRDGGCYLNDKRVATSNKKTLDKGTFVAIDHDAVSRDITRLIKLYGLARIQDYYSAGFHLAGVSSGIFDAYISYNKAHELGAGYLLVRESGGHLIDFEGNKLDNKRYDFNARYPIVATATPELAELILAGIK